MASGLRFGPIDEAAVHLCVDMQGIFRGDSPWAMPWFDRVLPHIEALVGKDPTRTVFTRFIPARNAQDVGGTWLRYYQRWNNMTLDNLDAGQVDIVPELARHVPPARTFDKVVYSPWQSGELFLHLNRGAVRTLIVSGGETDVCVLASVLGAIDLGFRVIVASDAVCSSSDAAHDAMQLFYGQRLSQQVETAETEEILDCWSAYYQFPV
ncbi:Nicotinamidase-related amidase [Phyllobacterium sp. CL33Tsu]|uniref:cysteine hydrolase family protein n=1 Tax=Phyllobacterium sp. CL33Tsu TaxID=1798191 RepID=UPI0008ECB159|nr:cysteine hydrolase [Phyllobacterium sp. CL33Tsu]SFJ03630.1 Nicotinamidase-related amidase [Phyllobacterium sp. CL33Tsu]